MATGYSPESNIREGAIAAASQRGRQAAIDAAGRNPGDEIGTHFKSFDGKERNFLVEGNGGPSWYTEYNVLEGLSARSFGRFRAVATRHFDAWMRMMCGGLASGAHVFSIGFRRSAAKTNRRQFGATRPRPPGTGQRAPAPRGRFWYRASLESVSFPDGRDFLRH
jgi:hypothetical protein